MVERLNNSGYFTLQTFRKMIHISVKMNFDLFSKDKIKIIITVNMKYILSKMAEKGGFI